MATVMIAHASKDEHGKYAGGKAGDQTGLEVCIRSWYSRPWNVVIRFKDQNRSKKVAEAMTKATKNDHIGYDQNQRNTLLTLARKVGYDPARVTADCETDCSALVSVACMYAGVPESALFRNGNSATTRTLRSWLSATGMVDVYTSKEYVGKPDNLQIGDILLSEGHHVAVVVSNNVTAAKPISDIAREVAAGKWGNGADRASKLKAAGYDPVAVQTEVNKLLKGGA